MNKNKASRPRQRTAHAMLNSLPGSTAFYVESPSTSMLEGYASEVRGRPYLISAFDTIETIVRGITDGSVVLDVRAMIDVPEMIVRNDGRDRSLVTLRFPNGEPVRMGLDAPRPQVEEVIRKARR